MSKAPNILLICTDQHRHDYLGYAGAHWLRTPNIDRLAARGTVFTRAYTNSPLCAPARCALATGLLPSHTGCLDNFQYTPLHAQTFYQRLRDHGYWTGFVGKLDLEKLSEQKQLSRDGRLPIHYSLGFCDPCDTAGSMVPVDAPNHAYGHYLADKGLLEAFNRDRQDRCSLLPGLVDVSYYGYPPVDLANVGLPENWVARVSQDWPLPTEDHNDAFTARRSIEWLENASDDRPWFLQVNFCGPHDPFDPPAEFADKYRNADVPDPIPADYTGKPRWIANRFATDHAESIRFTRRQYSALIEHLDFQIGKILETIEKRGMMDNTIIIFTSDHGEMLGDFGFYIKSVPYEASSRIPLMICGPGIPQGHRSDALVELIDLNATCCELAGLPPQSDIDARSLMPLLRSNAAAAPHRDAVVMVEHNYACIRDSRYKYVKSYNDLEELYDLENDPQELHNLIGDPAGQKAHASLRWQMLGRLRQRMTEGLWNR